MGAVTTREKNVQYKKQKSIDGKNHWRLYFMLQRGPHVRGDLLFAREREENLQI